MERNRCPNFIRCGFKCSTHITENLQSAFVYSTADLAAHLAEIRHDICSLTGSDHTVVHHEGGATGNIDVTAAVAAAEDHPDDVTAVAMRLCLPEEE